MLYGVNFLAEVGYFRKADRFWTREDFPEARRNLQIIEAKIRSMRSADASLKDALATLEELKR